MRTSIKAFTSGRIRSELGSEWHLAERGVRPLDHVGDDADHRYAIEELLLPIPVIALVRPGPGTTLKTPGRPVTRAAASAMTLADDSFVTSR